MWKMDIRTMTFVLIFTASIQAYATDRRQRSNTNEFIIRTKRQEDPWTWGNADPLEGNANARLQSTETPVSERTTESNPCNRPLPPKPDFSAPGRRISASKCYEYIWEIKRRQDQSEKSIACARYLASQQANTGVQFAIGGRNALPGEFPHMGALGWKAVIGTWVFQCGGSLISDKFLLTAAHCSKASSRDTTIADIVPKIVRLGDKNIIDVWSNGLPPTDVNISRIILHPEYKSPLKYNDIALIEFETEVRFSANVQPACLWTEFDTSSLGIQATVTGWGTIETGGRKISPDLQAAVVDVMDNEQCDSLLRPMCNRNWCGIKDDQICAGKQEGGVDACWGDSGGPLQVKIPLPSTEEGAMHYVIGITSFGFGCAIANTPGVYTRVSTFVDWIEKIVWQ